MNTKSQTYKPEKTRVTTWIDPILSSQLRAYAGLLDITVSEAVERLIRLEVANKMKIEIMVEQASPLDKLASKALQEHKEGKTTIIDTPEKLKIYLQKLQDSV